MSSNMTKLEREIKKYNIVSLTLARGSGSIHASHDQRCLWPLCGKPMIQWALEVAKASKYVNKVVLSCEDPEVLDVGKKIGVTVIPRVLTTVFNEPRDYNSGIFQRELPRSLFSGEPSVYTNYRDYCFYYLKEYESYVPHIQVGVAANEPLGRTESLDRLIEAFFEDEEADHGICFYPIMPDIHIINPITNRPVPVLQSAGVDRQKSTPLYRSGALSIFGKASKVSYGHSRLAYIIVSPDEGLDVHDEEDLELAEFYMKKRQKEKEEKK